MKNDIHINTQVLELVRSMNDTHMQLDARVNYYNTLKTYQAFITNELIGFEKRYSRKLHEMGLMEKQTKKRRDYA